MKLIRFGPIKKEKPGILLGDEIYDVSDYVNDYGEAFFEDGGIEEIQRIIKEDHQLPVVDPGQRTGAPICRPSKIVCIGLNYADHAKETGASLPKEPVLFLKATSAIIGPFDDIIIPKNSTKTDWEVELGVVIGKTASYVKEESAMDYVAGYILHNDVSEREFQMNRGGTWDKGKGCDTFAPLGPYFVTKDDIEDVHNLRLWLKVNGHIMQDGTTANLIFNIPYLVSYVSQFMTLLPGDIISTGTPAGVGFGMKPETYLKDGDVVELGIDGLGSSKQAVKKYAGN